MRAIAGRVVRAAIVSVSLLGAAHAALAPAQSPIREPLDVARILAARYPANVTMSYIPALAWSSALRLSALTGEEGWRDKARQQMTPFVSGDTPSIAEPYTLASLSGHFALFDFGNVAATRKAADLILPPDQAVAVRFARGWTDDMFMASSLLARVASRSPADRYSKAVGRLLVEYSDKLQRADGLFIHAADSPHAWGRGNGFAVLGLVEALTHLPERWPDRRRVLDVYRRHMRALARHQSDDGSWRQVVDEPASYRELTVTAMTTAAMARGVRLGWLDRDFLTAIDRGWGAVIARVADDGAVRDVCSSTGAGSTKEYYLNRPAINDADDRGGAMALLAALEIADLRRKHYAQKKKAGLLAAAGAVSAVTPGSGSWISEPVRIVSHLTCPPRAHRGSTWPDAAQSSQWSGPAAR